MYVSSLVDCRYSNYRAKLEYSIYLTYPYISQDGEPPERDLCCFNAALQHLLKHRIFVLALWYFFHRREFTGLHRDKFTDDVFPIVTIFYV